MLYWSLSKLSERSGSNGLRQALSDMINYQLSINNLQLAIQIATSK